MPTPGPEVASGDVWRVEFSEGGFRPGIVVSRAALSRGRTLLVVPCTTAQVETRRRTPNHVFLPAGAGGLTADSVAQAHLIQPVDRDWLERRLGRVPAPTLEAILLAVAWATGLFEVLGRDRGDVVRERRASYSRQPARSRRR